MSSAQIIIILVTVAAIGVFGYLRLDKNEYAERESAPDSAESKAAEAIFKQLAQSTNYLAQCISPKASPVVQQMLLRSAVALKESGELTLVDAHWSGEYLKVQVKAPTDDDEAAQQWFTLESEANGELKLLGVQ
jgi:hypothetical protein